MHRSLIAAGALLLLGSVAILPVLPWTMGIVTDVKYSYTATVPPENRGAYLLTSQGAMQLYSWDVEPDDFPPDAPTLPLGAIQSFTVVQKQFGDLANYQLINLDTEVQYGWAPASKNGMELTLRPRQQLPAGEYVLIVPSDGMFGGMSWQYFRIL